MVEQHVHNTLRAAAAKRRLAVILGAIATIVLAAIAASIGQGPAAFLPMLVLIAGEIAHAWPAAIYLISAHGMGRLLFPLWAGARDRTACQFASGLALMLTLSHLLGVLGLLSPAPALAVSAIGVALCLRQVFGPPAANTLHPRTPSWVWLAGVPAAAVVLAAMSVPPGVLWASEFGGFDVLSYHLQLPQEWIAAGRVWPVEHNVYSYLPGYVETAFAHTAVMSFPPAAEALVGEGGWRLTSAQALHAGLWGASAWLTARAASTWLARAGLDDRTAQHAGAVGGVLVAATPWTVVVGSMAYNEMAVIALGAGSLLVAAEQDLKPGARGTLVGLLVGVAAGAKPSAALMIAPMAGFALLGLAPAKQWRAMVTGGLVMGVFAVAPWLIRNAIATGNPVFPFATGIFGTGHWSSEQAARWSAAHHATGSIWDHIRLLLGADPAAAANAPPVERHRGMSHPQWGILFWVWALASVLAVLPRMARAQAVVLLLGSAASLGVWLLMTHHQSRFLLPMVLPAGMALALMCGLAAGLGDIGRIALGIGAVLGLAQAGQTWRVWSDQGGGSPANLLGQGSVFFTGEAFSPEDRQELPTGFARMIAGDLNGSLYLLGDSTPLYWPAGTVYSTTWDDGPLSRAVREAPDDPDAWVRMLREEGISAVMVNQAELARLGASGWLPPELAAANIAELVARCRVVRTWPGRGMRLLAIPASGARANDRSGR